MPSFVPLLSLILLVLVSALAWAAPQQQRPVDRTEAVRVFLDCRSCDENYLRTEITFINYVRDRATADLHILVTTQPTGGGGTEFTLKFIGLGRFQGVEQQLSYVAPQTNTDDETRKALARVLKLGLVRYAADTPLGSQLDVSYKAPEAASAAGVRDPWNFWVFRVGIGGEFEGARSDKSSSIEGFFTASRTTDRWKLAFNTNTDYREDRFVLEDESTFVSITRTNEGNALAVRSLNEHWSIGAVGSLSSSTFLNHRFRMRAGPAIEYSVFPYSESTRRLLTLYYTAGYHRFDYREITLFDKTEETLADQLFEASLNLRQPWGNAFASAQIAQYLTDLDKYRISGFGELEVRLFKGFSVEVFGELSRRRDQIYLPKGEASNEEILVRQRELATGYQYDINFGISYSFGSIYNNIVNPRFRSAGGF